MIKMALSKSVDAHNVKIVMNYYLDQRQYRLNDKLRPYVDKKAGLQNAARQKDAQIYSDVYFLCGNQGTKALVYLAYSR